MLDTEIDWERRKKSEDWVREKSKEYDLHELTFAEWLYIEGARDFAEWVNYQDLEMYGADEMLRFWKEEREEQCTKIKMK